MSTSTDLTDAKIYDQIFSDIQRTDDISFKLMGIVPLVSGTGLIAILFAEHLPSPPILLLLSLFAAAITLGLFRWELRNIQNCSWLIEFADELVNKSLQQPGLPEVHVKHPKPPQKIGKTEAEKIIYTVTIATWLALPALLLSHGKFDLWLYNIYLPIAFVIAIATIMSLFAKTEPLKKVIRHKCENKSQG